MEEYKISKKTKEDVQLTGCPVTRTGQLNLDQLIPALGVHLCLQLEDWFKKKYLAKKKIFLPLNPLTAVNCESVPHVLRWMDEVERERECYDQAAEISTSVQPGTPSFFSRLTACTGRRIRRMVVVLLLVGGLGWGCA